MVSQDLSRASSFRFSRRQEVYLESLLHQGPGGAVLPRNEFGDHSGLSLCVRFHLHPLYRSNDQIGQYVGQSRRRLFRKDM